MTYHYTEGMYPDAALAKAIRHAAKPWKDPAQARLAWRRLIHMLDERGANAPGLSPKPPTLGLTQHEAGRQNLIDASAWIVSSALNMGTMAADYRAQLANCARVFGTPRRRRPHELRAKSLTTKQRAAYQAVSESGGNVAEAARRLHRDRSTVRQHFDAALRKLDEVPLPKGKTYRLSEDWRGEANVDADRRRPQQG